MGFELSSATTALAGYGLTLLLQSTALLIFGLAFGRLAKRYGPAVQSGIYRTTLVAIMVCPAASALLAAAGFDGLAIRLESPKAEVETPRTATQAAMPAQPQTTGLPGGLPPTDVSPLPVSELTVPPHPSDAIPIERPAEPPPFPRYGKRVSAVAVGLGVWLFGAVMLLARLGISQRRMARLKASATAADPIASQLCRELAVRMQVAAPEVLRSPFLFSPCLDGIRRPVILLPDGVDENLHETFVHELAHLLRRDGLWNLLRRSSTALLWMQPLLWLLSRRPRIDGGRRVRRLRGRVRRRSCPVRRPPAGPRRPHAAAGLACGRRHDRAAVDALAADRQDPRLVSKALDQAGREGPGGHAGLRLHGHVARGPARRRRGPARGTRESRSRDRRRG